MKKKEAIKGEGIGYREAIEELEKLVVKIEDPSTNIEEIAPLVKRSMELTEICRRELGRYKEEIDKLQTN
ncbi:MAG: exodeoxyribonuclease VII small subunit [Bacteroidales bacterium]|jgi:exodeoxyribonuclease VII small subunit|nr:exodeoxyribonuclease VII small subunit [Bacteroidales bacterium]MDD4057401.1 exodeoxyribonuclease VII small subunit [Bacteroidales bacterium]